MVTLRADLELVTQAARNALRLFGQEARRIGDNLNFQLGVDTDSATAAVRAFANGIEAIQSSVEIGAEVDLSEMRELIALTTQIDNDILNYLVTVETGSIRELEGFLDLIDGEVLDISARVADGDVEALARELLALQGSIIALEATVDESDLAAFEDRVGNLQDTILELIVQVTGEGSLEAVAAEASRLDGFTADIIVNALDNGSLDGIEAQTQSINNKRVNIPVGVDGASQVTDLCDSLVDAQDKADGVATSIGEIAVPAAALGAVSALTGGTAEFDEQLREVTTILGDLTGAEFEALRSEVLETAEGINRYPNEILPSLYQALSAGIDRDNVFDFITTANTAAVAGIAPLKDSVDVLTSVVNAYTFEAVSAEEASDILFRTVQKGKCLTGDTKILLADGRYVRIDGLEHESTPVVSFNGSTFEERDSGWVYQGEKQTVEMVTANGRKVKTTWTHPYLTEDGWKMVEELSPGDKIAVPTQLPYFGNRTVDSWLPGFLGLWIAEGSSKSSSPRVTTSKYGADVKSWGAAMGCDVRNVENRPDHTPTWQIYYPDNTTGKRRRSPAITALRNHGLWNTSAGEKHIPEQVFTWNRAQFAEFMHWLFNGDGWLSHSVDSRGKHQFELGFISKSERLVRDVSHAMLRFGVGGSIRRKSNADAWTWTTSRKDNIERFIDEVGIDRDGVDAFLDHDFSPKHCRPMKRPYDYVPIATITEGPVEPVYDLIVPGLENFVAEDVIAHNTTFGELTIQIGDIVPTANAAFVGFEEVAGAIAQLTLQGLSTPKAVTALNVALSELINPTSQLAEFFLDAAGVAFPEFTKAGGTLTEALEIMSVAVEDVDGGFSALGSIEAAKGLNILTSDAQRTAEIIASVADSSGAAQGAFDKMAQSANFAAKEILTQLVAAALDLSTQLLPLVVRVLNAVSAFVGLLDAAGLLQPILAVLAGTVASLGTLGGAALVFKSIGAVLGSITGIAAQVTAVLGVQLPGGISTLLTIGRTLVAFLTGPIGLAIAAVVGAAILLERQFGLLSAGWEAAVGLFQRTAPIIIGFFEGVVEAANTLISNIDFDLLVRTAVVAESFIRRLLESLDFSQVSAAIAQFAGFLDGIFQGVGSVVAQVSGSIQTGLAGVGAAFQAVAPAIASLAGPINSLILGLGDVVLNFLSAATEVGTFAAQVTRAGAAGEVFGEFLRRIATLIGTVVGGIASFASEVSAFIASIDFAAIFNQLLAGGQAVIDFFSGIVTAVAPIFQALFAAVAGLDLSPILDGLASAFGSIRDALAEIDFTAILNNLQALGGFLLEVGRIVGIAIIVPFGLVAIAIREVVEVLVSFVQLIDGPVIAALTFLAGLLGPVLQAGIEAIGNVFAAVGEVIAGVIGVITNLLAGDFSGAWDSALQIVTGFLSGITGLLGPLASLIIGALGSLAGVVVDALGTAFTAAIDAIVGFFSGAGDTIAAEGPGVWQGFLDFMADLPRLIGFLLGRGIQIVVLGLVDLATAVYDWLADELEPAIEEAAAVAWEAFTTAIEDAVKAIPGLLADAASAIASGFTAMIRAIARFGPRILKAIAIGFVAIPVIIGKALLLAVQAVIQWGPRLIAAAASAIAGFVSSVVTGFPGFIVAVGNALEGAIDAVANFGEDLITAGAGIVLDFISGFIEGLFGVEVDLRNIVGGWYEAATGWIDDAIGEVTGFGGRVISAIVGGLVGITEAIAGPFGDAAGAVGDSLGDVIQTALNFTGDLIDTIVGGLANFVDSFLAPFAEAVAGVALWVGEVVVFVLTLPARLIEAITVGMAQFVVALLTPLAQVLVDIVAWGADLVVTITQPFRDLGQALLDVILGFADRVIGGWITIGEGIFNVVSGWAQGIADFLEPVIDFFQRWTERILGLVTSGWNAVVETTGEIISGIVGIITGVWDEVANATEFAIDVISSVASNGWNAIVETAGEIFSTLWNAISGAFETVTTSIGNFVEDSWNTVKRWADNFIEFAKSGLSVFWNAIRDAFETVTTNVVAWVESGLNTIREWATSFIQTAVEFLSPFWNSLVGIFEEVTSGIANWVLARIDQIRNFASSVIDTVQNGLSGLPGIFTGIWDLVRDTVTGFIDDVKGFINRFIEDLPGDFAGVGDAIGSAVAGGIRAAINGVIDAINSIPDISIPGIDFLGFPGITIPIPNIPRLFRGGIVEKGQQGLIEGFAREVAIPLEGPYGSEARRLQLLQESGLYDLVTKDLLAQRQMVMAGMGRASGPTDNSTRVTNNYYQRIVVNGTDLTTKAGARRVKRRVRW